MKTSLKLKLTEPRMQPRLTSDQKCRRLDFANAKKRTILSCRCVLFSEEAPFELFQVPNRQDDRVRTNSSSDVPTFQTVKQPMRRLVWGMMSYRDLSELQRLPRKQTMAADYYASKVLKKTQPRRCSGRRKWATNQSQTSDRHV